MSREQWLALRRESIGASDAPVIAGLSKYKSRFGLWLEKTGQSEPEEAGEEAWWGTNLEGLIEDRLYKHHDVVPASRQAMIRHAERPWMTATLDMVSSSGELWEFKAVGIHAGKKLEDFDNSTLPDSWILQAHHQMACADEPYVNFAVFVGHRLRLCRFVVPWVHEIQEGLTQLETEFRRHVEDRTPPTEFDAQDAALLLKHYRSIEGEEVINASPRIAKLCDQYEVASAAAKFQGELANQLKAALLAEMRNAPALLCQNYKLRRSIVNVKADPAPKPRAAASYTKFTFTNTESED